MRCSRWLLGSTVFFAVVAPFALGAEDAHVPLAYLTDGSDSPIAVYVAATRDGADNKADGLGQGVDNATLAGLSGGAAVTQNTTLNGTVSNDSASHVVTGDNVINGGAFASEAGIPTVIQNSGNNVLIQSAVVLNVEFKP